MKIEWKATSSFLFSQPAERHNADMEPFERASIQNAIHLCPTCHTMVDITGAEAAGYTVELLRGWKKAAEGRALAAMTHCDSPSSCLVM
jgi:hypothetical protein